MPNASAEVTPIPLYLEVFINGQPTGLVSAFTLVGGAGLSVKVEDLRELGLRPPHNVPASSEVFLDNLDGIQYTYDDASQTVNIETSDEHRIKQKYDAGGSSEPIELTPPSRGAVINYAVYGNISNHSNAGIAFEGASLSLDTRVFSKYGTLSNAGFIRTVDTRAAEIVRLDSEYSYADPSSARVYRAGDTISGGVAWTRPIRLGGFQVQRNFSLRPDLITTPLAAVSGSAAVPSTVDVYVGNVKAHSEKVAAGPFEINNIPTVSGAGTARVVVRDATGRETETTSSFYASSALLRKGLFDFSAEVGFPRLDYGSRSFHYSDEFFGSVSARYGLRDTITVEGHVEVSDALLNGGVGLVAPVRDSALLSVAGSGSISEDGSGVLIYGSLDTQVFGLSVHASTQRTFGSYHDIASVTADRSMRLSADIAASLISGRDVPTAIDRVSVGVPLENLRGSLNFSFLHVDTKANEPSYVITANYSQSLLGRMSLYASFSSDLDELDAPSFFAGLSMPLGDWGGATAGISRTGSGGRFGMTYSRPIGPEPGSFGWRIRNSEGESTNRHAALTYRAEAAYVEATVNQVDDVIQSSGYVEGSVAIIGGGVFLANRIDDAFAVVDTGLPNVPVRLANRPVGNTNESGRLLVPGLRSYERNHIQIDPKDLPVNAKIPTTHAQVVPGDRAGITVKFDVDADADSAIVIFTDESGEFLPVGSVGWVEGTGEEFVVGYDGRAFIENLSRSNGVTIELPRGVCKASFEYVSKFNDQAEISGVRCL